MSHLSAENICRILLKKGFISKEQRQEIFNKKDTLQKKLEKLQVIKDASGVSSSRIINPVTIIDIICFLKLDRKDDPTRELDEETIFQALAEEWKIEYKKIDPLELDLKLVTTIIPRSFAMKHLVLPIAVKDSWLTVATPNPHNLEVMEDISRVSQLQVKPVVSSKSDIIKLINEFYGFRKSIAAAEEQFSYPSVDLGNLEQYVRLREVKDLPSDDRHIVNAVDHLFNYAFDQRASDIHIEPKRDTSLVRLRIDGVLHSIYKLPKTVHGAIISRIKALSRLDMAEKRRPQDGRIKIDRGQGDEAEIRVSTIPTAFGEKTVMRILDPDILFQDVGQLGMTSMDLVRYQQFINFPHGLVLVCGPTGSGKSTTLYSTLRYLSTEEKNITTVEDPIEMVHEDFNQIAVQPSADITFANILRNILRQDPDIIMIGEMRDLETAQNAIQATLTGHLVLSTLHTNDAPLAVTRLVDIGVPRFLIHATLTGVLSQRLLRKICPYCSESFEMSADNLMAMGIKTDRTGMIRLKRGNGCIKCRGTGYLGRVGIFEVLSVTERIKDIIAQGGSADMIRQAACNEGMVTLRENAVKKMLDGETTYQEVIRVTWG
ncbi:MAG TPA: type II/IV secretion system protein, partial [Desulfobacteraceae bacterium]|nr:type II/IV secretion system protein [Desulfobacteraceae bacterium]